jgi:putative addiction module CopG family antidote
MPEDLSLEQFVTQQLQSGKYQSYEEMVEAGLRLLQEREAELDRIAEKLRPAAERFKRGEPGIPFDADEIIRRGTERLAAEQRHP